MLKIRLKPGEKILLNGSVLSNGDNTNITLILHNDAPVMLRESDIMLKLSDTPNIYEHLYFLTQEVYMSGNDTLKTELLDELSMLTEMFPEEQLYNTLKQYVMDNRFYPAIKEIKKCLT